MTDYQLKEFYNSEFGLMSFLNDLGNGLFRVGVICTETNDLLDETFFRNYDEALKYAEDTIQLIN